MRRLWLVCVLPGCVWISDETLQQRVDQDGDGVYMMGYHDGTDCDDHDPEFSDPLTFYADADGDGYGDPDNPTEACAQPEGYVVDALDCDDSDAGVYPGAVEICSDGKDNDCDGLTCLPPGTYAMPLGASLEDLDLGGSEMDFALHDGDFLLGVPRSDGTGAAWRFPVPLDGEVATADAAGVAVGDPESAMGGSVALGDLTGDGVPEVVVGAPGLETFGGYLDGGGLTVFTGPLSGSLAMSDAVLLIEGSDDEERLGSQVMVLPDFDGDGLNDLLVGASGFDGGSFGQIPNVGAWLFVPGTTTGSLGSAAFSLGIEGSEVWNTARRPPALADFDGTGDLSLVLPAVSPASNEDAGAVFILDYPISGPGFIEDSPRTIRGSGTLDQGFAHDIAVGDLNGDGQDDLFIGAPGDLLELGAVYVFYGGPGVRNTDNQADLVLRGDTEGERMGAAVAFGADLDGDEGGELVVGVPGGAAGAGRVYVYLEAIQGTADGSDAGYILTAPAGVVDMGTWLAAGIDLNGDGFRDAVVGGRDDLGQGVVLLAVGGSL
ncbi:MAG: FG-GAP repeat protein [Alphaproteobacteria bacterium]|nr:FG-GAP repeat protein [Alphaproteobacteria bacterium]